jgi:chromosome segregation ATPase
MESQTFTNNNYVLTVRPALTRIQEEINARNQVFYGRTDELLQNMRNMNNVQNQRLEAMNNNLNQMNQIMNQRNDDLNHRMNGINNAVVQLNARVVELREKTNGMNLAMNQFGNHITRVGGQMAETGRYNGELYANLLKRIDVIEKYLRGQTTTKSGDEK